MSLPVPVHVHSTAGAVPVKNEKGQMYMVKVKVQRYVAGKKPDFASSSSDESDEEVQNKTTEEIKAFSVSSGTLRERRRVQDAVQDGQGTYDQPTAEELADPRYRRLLKAKDKLKEVSDDEDDDRAARHKKFRRLGNESEESDKNSDDEDADGEEDVDERELLRRREFIRQRALAVRAVTDNENLNGDLGHQDEDDEDEELGFSEEEYTSSEDEIAPKLKPVFVRARDRITLQAKQKADQIAQHTEAEVKRLTEERRRTTLKLLESELRREAEEAHALEDALEAIDSDEGQGNPQAEQEEYERWKVRELKRIRRGRDLKEILVQEKLEIECIRNMTDDQRHEEFLRNPRKITNLAPKSQYKFLQKYYHRGSFFVQDEENRLYQQDFAQPTLEDHFDKTKVPKIMQVKNFGLAGRTKYTHLVDQDTTSYDSPWSSTNMSNVKFQSRHGGGFKQLFNKPGALKKSA